MSTCTDKFHYDDLSEADSIRGLILHPGTLESPIQSDPVHTTLHECRCGIHDDYTTLSYVWGDANDTTYIVVDGFQFTVTANLAAALYDFCDKKRQPRLWADAVCINQTNNAERSQRVGLMEEIYSFAQNTVIYLAALLEHTKCLFELMQQRDPDRSKLSGMADDALNDIVSRPWFTRVWVYQELILSNIVFVQLGRMRVHWDDLYEVFLDKDRDRGDRNLSSKDRIMSPHPMILDLCEDNELETKSRTSELSSMDPAMREIRHDHDQNCLRYGIRVISLLCVPVSRSFKASDLRDIIYAYLAVADLQLKHVYEGNIGSPPWPLVRNWSLQEHIPVVDYNKSVEDVFLEAARFASSFQSVDELLKVLHHDDVNAS